MARVSMLFFNNTIRFSFFISPLHVMKSRFDLSARSWLLYPTIDVVGHYPALRMDIQILTVTPVYTLYGIVYKCIGEGAYYIEML